MKMGWVEARLKCSVEGAWITLRETLSSDIARWAQLTNAEPGSLTVNKEERRLIISRKDSLGRGFPWARVEITHAGITVTCSAPSSPDSSVTSQFVPKLNERGECRLWVEESEMDFEQASRRILEPVLFG